jgi:hypothetical protein
VRIGQPEAEAHATAPARSAILPPPQP